MPDNPYPPPAPSTLSMMLRVFMWNDEIDPDDARKYAEWSADTIEHLMARLVRQAKVIETLEAARQ